MGIAISGMHYTGMAAARFVHTPGGFSNHSDLIASSNLAILVVGTTAFILIMALTGSLFERALARRTRQAQESTRLFEEANRALGALREERELRERFVSGLTHDLRTPLTAAKLAAQLMIRQIEEPEKAHQLGAKVIEGLDRVDHMIQDLLDAHRISANQKLPLKVAEFDLKDLVQHTIDGLAVVYGDRFVLRAQGQTRGWWDPSYLRRAVENLCGNAVKYGYSNTPIAVSVTAPQDRIEGEIRLFVHNEGEALTPGERKELFQLFHRTKSAQVSGTKGWGIGLTLVKGVAESHGGRVEVESERSRGTTFSLRLPRDTRTLADAAASA